MVPEKTAFANYLDALDSVLEGRRTIQEAINNIEETDGPSYAEIARQGFREAFGDGNPEFRR
jgi:hypothetical protein